MDPSPPTLRTSHKKLPHPDFEQVALVLQGGGALGSYQAGVFQAIDEAGTGESDLPKALTCGPNPTISPAIAKLRQPAGVVETRAANVKDLTDINAASLAKPTLKAKEPLHEHRPCGLRYDGSGDQPMAQPVGDATPAL